MDDHPDNAPPIQPWDIFALAACAPLRGQAGCHIAPRIPAEIAVGVLNHGVRLGPDELLLAVVTPPGAATVAGGCALTSRRVCGAETSSGDSPADTPWTFSLEYGKRPGAVEVVGSLAPRIDLGGGRSLAIAGQERPVLEALAGVLNTLGRARQTGDLAGSAPPEDIARARAVIAGVARQAEALRQAVGEIGAFRTAALAATPHVVVTYLLVAACVLVYLAMVATGASPLNPDAPTLYAWGANLGAALAVGGESWRLLSACFLHGGLIHLAVNMWCLYQVGPLVERLFGNVGFALLYLAAGLGGFLASAWAHPMVVSVGASGAIFGLFGGLLAFLLRHRQAIPGAIVSSVRGGVTAFIGYNILFGFLVPGIDNAAHLGGLATGFVAGLLLGRRWPLPRPTAGLAMQFLGGVVLGLVLLLLRGAVVRHINADPEVVAAARQIGAPADAYNALMRSLGPLASRFDQINDSLLSLVDRVEREPAADIQATLSPLLAQAETNRSALGSLSVDDPDLAGVLASLVEAQTEQLRALRALARIANPAAAPPSEASEGLVEAYRRSMEAIGRFHERREAFLSKYGLVAEDAPVPPVPGERSDPSE